MRFKKYNFIIYIKKTNSVDLKIKSFNKTYNKN